MADGVRAEVGEVFERTVTCELATIAKADERPIATPMTHLRRGDLGQFILSSSLVVPRKRRQLAQRARRGWREHRRLCR